MILSAHIVAGSAIAVKTCNPILGIVFALLSHYVLDSIPHWEYSIQELKERKVKKAILPLAKVAADLAVGFSAVAALANFGGYNIAYALSAGFLGALPDGISFMLFIFPKLPLLKQQNAFHQLIHYPSFTPPLNGRQVKRPALMLGLVTQVITWGVAVLLLLL